MPRPLSQERFLRNTALTDLIRYCPRSESGRATIAIDRIDAYLRAAKTQQRRIGHLDARIRKKRRVDAAPGVSQRMAADIVGMAVEIHYYLICWNAVRQQLRLLQRDTGSRGIGLVLRTNRVTLEAYTRMRDNLEHFDERVVFRGRKGPGGSSTQPMRNPWDFGNFSRSTFSFGGDRVDISAKGMMKLQQIVEASKRALKEETWASIVRTEPALAERLLRSYARDLNLRSILRTLPGT